MQSLNWIQIAIGFLSGGAFGAILNNLVAAYRSRVQPIGIRTASVKVFQDTGGPSGLSAKIVVTQGTDTATFGNLFLVALEVANRGNLDNAEFDFGFTLAEADSCIHLEATSPDRHHQVIVKTSVTPTAPQRAVDLQLKPFNRGDSYSFKLYVVTGSNGREPELDLSSPKSVRFVRSPTMVEILARAATETILKVGPVSVELKR